MTQSRNPPAAVIALRALSTKWRERADNSDASEARGIEGCADDLDALVARVEPLPQEQLLAALEAAQQFLDPAVPRGPDVDGWRNTVDLVNTILAAHRAPPTQEPTSPTDPARDP